MHIENLVHMANQIEAFFAAEDDREIAIEGIRNHIARFWEKRMRQQILEHLAAGGEGLGELARAALERIREKQAA
jgi:formate dehydrogenase subunit delta